MGEPTGNPPPHGNRFGRGIAHGPTRFAPVPLPQPLPRRCLPRLQPHTAICARGLAPKAECGSRQASGPPRRSASVSAGGMAGTELPPFLIRSETFRFLGFNQSAPPTLKLRRNCSADSPIRKALRSTPRIHAGAPLMLPFFGRKEAACRR